jgi:hypothetical protein
MSVMGQTLHLRRKSDVCFTPEIGHWVAHICQDLAACLMSRRPKVTSSLGGKDKPGLRASFCYCLFSREITRKLLMQNLRFAPQSEKMRNEIKASERFLIPPSGGSIPPAPANSFI